MLPGRRRMDVGKLTDRFNAPVQGTGADGLKERAAGAACANDRRDGQAAGAWTPVSPA